MADSKPASARAAVTVSRTMSSASSSPARRTAVRASCWADETGVTPPRSCRRAPSIPAHRSTSATSSGPGAVGVSALSTPATRPPSRSGTQISACTEATASR